jgi:twitching motility two-component system response regulator PilH
MATILIVDDSKTDAYVHAGILKKLGHDISFAEDGEIGIEMAITNKPELILMDVIMPGQNGFQVTRKLSRNPETTNIPIIIISTKHDETDKIYGQRQGAIEYLVKPVEEDDLIAAVNKALS